MSMKKILLNPFCIFVFTWWGVLFFDYIYLLICGEVFYRLSIELYFLIFWMTLVWGIGGGVVSVLPKGVFLFKSMRFRLDVNTVIRVFSFFSIVSIFFRVLDIYLITGLPFYAPGSIEKYRVWLTVDLKPSNFTWLPLINYFIFYIPALLVSSFFLDEKPKRHLSFFCICAYLLFIYLSSSRSALFYSVLVSMFVYLHHRFIIRNIFLVFLLLFFMFGAMGALVGKPGFDKVFFYALTPVHALDVIYSGGTDMGYDLISFRFYHGILVKFGLINEALGSIPYIETPVKTNVFTVFGVYYLDYGLIGLSFFMFLFSVLTSFISRCAAIRKTPRSIFMVSVLYSVLVLGVFYDYYTSSFIVWSAAYSLFLFPSVYNSNATKNRNVSTELSVT